MYQKAFGGQPARDVARAIWVDASFCGFQQGAKIVNRRTRAFCGRLRPYGSLEDQFAA